MDKSVQKVKALRQGEPWDQSEDNRLCSAFKTGASVPQLMEQHKRSRGAILARLKKNALIDETYPSATSSFEAREKRSAPPLDALNAKEKSPTARLSNKYLNWKPNHIRSSELDPNTLCKNNHISQRVKGGLIKMGVTDVRQTFDLTSRQLLKTSNFGRKSFNELMAFRDAEFTNGKAVEPPNLEDMVEKSAADLMEVERAEKAIQAQTESSVNFIELKRKIRLIKKNLNAVSRQIHKYEYGFDTEALIETEARHWQPNGETAQVLIDLLTIIIEALILDQREQYILKARLGLAGNDQPHTLEHIAGQYDLTRERIRQLQKKANGHLVCALRDKNSEETFQFNEICAAIFLGKSAPPKDNIIDFVQSYYGSMFSAIDIAAYFCLSLGLSPSMKKTRLELNGIRIEKQKAAIEKLRAESSAARLQAKWSNMFQHCLYPARLEKFGEGVTGFDQTLRDPNSESSGIVGSFFSDKCQRNIQYESGEEFQVYQILENSPKIKWYREQPVAIPYQFRGNEYTYYPDVVALTDANLAVVIEVKPPSGPRSGMVHYIVLAKALAAKAYLHSKGIAYLMVDAHGRSLQTLSQIDYNDKVGDIILSAIDEEETLYYKRYKTLIAHEEFSASDLYSLVIKNDLAFQVYPFRLSKLPQGLSFAPLL